MADEKLTNKDFEEIASRVDVDKMEVIGRGKLRINLEIIEAIKANTGEKQSQEMIKAWTYRPENSQHQVIVSVSYTWIRLLKSLFTPNDSVTVDGRYIWSFWRTLWRAERVTYPFCPSA